MSSAISVAGLRKAYGRRTVLDGIDLDIPEGSVFSLLGPNGAGKTTTINILTTLLRADGGTVRVGGHDPVRRPDHVRRLIGVTGQFSAVDNLLTGRENLALMASLCHLGRTAGRARIDYLLDRFDLHEAADRLAHTYSGGMRRRLDLAMTLVGSPRIVFLDEPTAGLDPRSRHVMWQMIRDLVATGVTLFLTTQYLEEADQLAHQIAVLNGGRVVAAGTPDQLKRLVSGGHVRLQFSDPQRLVDAARKLGVESSDADALTLDVPSDGGAASLRALLDLLDRNEISVDGIWTHRPNLDDVFFALTTKDGYR